MWGVAARTRSHRSLASAVKVEVDSDGELPAAPPPSPARGRGRGRGRRGRGGIRRPLPAPGSLRRGRGEIPVIVIDDDSDDEVGGGEREESCGGRGALHATAPPRRGRARGGDPVAARTRSRMASCHYDLGAAAAASGVPAGAGDGSSSSPVPSELSERREAEEPSGSLAACGEVSVGISGGGAIARSADEEGSEAAASVLGGGEDRAEVERRVGDGVAAVGSSSGVGSGNGEDRAEVERRVGDGVAAVGSSSGVGSGNGEDRAEVERRVGNGVAAVGSSSGVGSGNGEDRAEVERRVGNGVAAVGSSSGVGSGNGSGDFNPVSSGDSLSTRGDAAGVEVQSGGTLASDTGTKQMGLQSLHASSESAPSVGGDRAGEGATAEGAGTTSTGESGSKSSHSRGVPGLQDAASSQGGLGEFGNELRNCVARRTRSKIFGDKCKTVDYKAFFKESESSDFDGEDVDDSDSEGTRLWTPPPSASLLSPSSSSSSSSPESNGETEHSDEGWTEKMVDGVIVGAESGRNYGGNGKSVVKKRFSCSTGGNIGHMDDFVSTGSTGIAHRSLKDGNSKEKGKVGTVSHRHCADGDKFVSSRAHIDGKNNVECDKKSLYKKPAKVIASDSDDCFEGETPLKRQQKAKRQEDRMGKSNKRKRAPTLKGDSLFKIFIDTIWGKAETLPEELLPPKAETTIKKKESLPLIFSFGDEDPKPVEKSEYEKKMDELWSEFDFVLNSNDIGSYKPCECEIEEMDVEEDNNHHCCSKGGHQLVLDEQIGIKCKLCSFVKLEIKYILPSLAAERSEGIFGRPALGNQENLPLLDGLFAGEDQESRGDRFQPSEGTVWDLIPGIKSTLYPHQQEAFEFLWKNLAGDIFLNNLKKSASHDGLGGCVISHAPGTGKSRLTVVFLQAFLRVFPKCRPVIVAPRGMLLTWKKESEKWKIDIPVHVLNEHQFSGTEDDVALRLVLGKHRKRQWSRVVKLYSWDKGRSILALSYCLFEKLVGGLNKEGTVSADLGKILLDRPGLFVFDEGHTPRNERSLIWKALGKIKTERRIILSGTPFQNNFGELYNTFCLVRPKFADRISCDTSKNSQRREFMIDNEENTLPARDEGRGKWASLTNSITDEILEELRSMMKPFVHVHNGSSLRCLPGLKDCLIVLDPLPRQKSILEVVEDIRSDTTFAMEYKISLASVHPSLLTACTLSQKEASEVDILKLESIKLNPNEGVKTRFVMELVRLCQPLNERVLVFSQYIEPLDLIIKQLEPPFGWKEGTEILKMDGKIRPRHRQSLIDDFNDPKSKARVLLASIKACSEGISLTGASRVVLLDVVWNPSVERQAISRAYRLGQEKVVYIYHLITYGTREGDKYYKQIEKDRLSKLVFSSAGGHKNVQDDSLSVSEDKILKEMLGHDKLKDMFKRILYQPKESNLIDAFMF